MAMSEPLEPLGGAGAENGGAVLPCGRDLADLWDQEDQNAGNGVPVAADSHTGDCPHCAAALEDFALLRDAVLHDIAETDADWEAGAARLTASIMDVVRLELRPGQTLALGEMDEEAWIYEAVAARTFRAAAENVPGVRAGSCRISPAAARRPGGRAPSIVRIEVTIGVTRDLQLAADRIRRKIGEQADQALGLQIVSIDVVITDLHHEPPGEES